MTDDRPDGAPDGWAPPAWGPPPTQGGPGYGPPSQGGRGYGPPPPQGGPGYGPPPQGGPGYGPPNWGPPYFVPAPPAAVRPALPTEPRQYQEFWRTPGVPKWKPLLILLLTVVGFLAINLVVTGIAMLIEAATVPGGFPEVAERLLDGEISQFIFIANSVALGLEIPLAFLLQRLTRQPPGFISSVVGRLRWKWMLACFGISLVAVVVLTAVEILLVGWDAMELSPQPGWLLLLLAIVVVTPFQAAGEEYTSRGLVMRAIASLIPNRYLGLLLAATVSSLIFMFLHSAADPWLNVVYFSMGMLFCYLTWRTGGLEAAIAMHTANNLVGLGFVPFQEWGGIFDRSAGTGGPVLLIQLFMFILATVAIELLARKRRIVASSAPAGGPSPS